MRGRVLILNQAKHYGKILFPDGEESRPMKFPPTYSSGDVVEVDFVNNDPWQKVIRMRAEAPEKYYGSLLLPSQYGTKKYSSIITSYPQPLGLIYYPPRSINFIPSASAQYVSFSLDKDEEGRLSPRNIQVVKRNEEYKCKTPLFGRLYQKSKPVLDGYIKEIVKSQNSVQSDNTRNFLYWSYQRNIDYTTGKQEEKYCIVQTDKKTYRIEIKEYVKVYGKKPSVGDLLRYTEEANSIRLCATSQNEIQSLIFKEDIAIPEQAVFGEIKRYFPDKGFGFVQQDGTGLDFFFHKSAFQGALPRIYPGMRLAFTIGVDSRRDKPVVQQAFYATEYECDETQFKGFASLDPERLYLCYIDANNKVREVSQVDFGQLSLAIAYYKSKNRNNEQLLKAINTMIEHQFSDTKINLCDLQNERLQLLKQLLQEAVKAKHRYKLEEYQYQLQMLEYKPEELLNSSNEDEQYAFITEVTQNITFLGQQSKIEIILEDPEIKPIFEEQAWELGQAEGSVNYSQQPAEVKWEIDLTEAPGLLTTNEDHQYYNINI